MSLLAQLQFWTLKNSIFIKDNNIGVFKVHDKNENALALEHPYLEDKETYAVSRGMTWTPKNKPFKLRDSLKHLEETLLTDRCVAVQWLRSGIIQLFFNSGHLVSLHLTTELGSIYKITTDRYLCGKLATDHITDMVRLDNVMFICYSEAKLTYIYFNKKPKRLDKLGTPDMHLVTIDLEGPPMQRFNRRLSVNSVKDCVLLWWSTRSNEVKPWMPTSSDRDRANLVVYALNNSSMELLSYAHTDGDVVSATFSSVHSDQVLTIEEHVSNSKKISVNICTYHVSRGRFLRISQTTIPLQGHVVCCQWSHREERLILACNDMSVVMFNAVRQITCLTMALFVPVEVAWHPSGTVVFIASEKGNLQCFDLGLTCLKLQLMSEELQQAKKLETSSFFKSPPLILRLLWENSEKSNKMCLLFDKGPIAMLNLSLGVMSQGQLSPFELVVQYLKEGLTDEAIGILHSLNWTTDAETCFKCMTTIVNFLIRKPLNHDRESQLEAALGSFYDTSHPLPDLIVEEYRQNMGHLARRFFHLLLRYERLEKAFLLAVDLGCRDLFMDLHHIAVDKNEMKLADVALQRVDQLDTHSMVSHSGDSESAEEVSELSEEDPQANHSDPPLIEFSPECDTGRESKHVEQSVRPKIPIPSRHPPAPPNASTVIKRTPESHFYNQLENQKKHFQPTSTTTMPTSPITTSESNFFNQLENQRKHVQSIATTMPASPTTKPEPHFYNKNTQPTTTMPTSPTTTPESHFYNKHTQPITAMPTSPTATPESHFYNKLENQRKHSQSISTVMPTSSTTPTPNFPFLSRLEEQRKNSAANLQTAKSTFSNQYTEQRKPFSTGATPDSNFYNRLQDYKRPSSNTSFQIQMATSFQNAVPSTSALLPNRSLPMRFEPPPPIIPPRHDTPFSPSKPSTLYNVPTFSNPERLTEQNHERFKHNANNNHLSSVRSQYILNPSEHLLPTANVNNPSEHVLDEEDDEDDETEDARIHFEHFGVI